MRHATAPRCVMPLALLLASLVFLMLGAGPTAAAVRYVAANGSSDPAVCGSESVPCRSIANAVAIAAPRDRIVVGPGVYTGFVLDKTVTLESTNGAAATIIEGADPAIHIQPGAVGAVIGRPNRGFTVRGGDFGIVVGGAPEVVIEDNVVTGTVLGIRVAVAGAVTIRRNTLTQNDVGLSVNSGDVAATSNNLFANTTNCGMETRSSAAVVTATQNYWGSPTGPGPDPADGVCGSPVVTTPFLRAPATVNNTGGR